MELINVTGSNKHSNSIANVSSQLHPLQILANDDMTLMQVKMRQPQSNSRPSHLRMDHPKASRNVVASDNYRKINSSQDEIGPLSASNKPHQAPKRLR